MKPVRVPDLRVMKERGEKIAVLTAYDYTMARLLDRAGVDIILVGDSVGMVVLGHDNTLPVTLDMMIHHTRAVSRGAKRALIVADMPFLTYRSEERRVGKECRSRWSADSEKKKGIDEQIERCGGEMSQ